MRETWLQPNRRAILFACVPPLLVAAVGAWPAVGASGSGWLRWFAAALAAAGLLTVAVLLSQLRRPRIAYRNGEMLLYLRSGPPIAVPIQVVEAFFLGQGPANLPGVQNRQRTVNLVARLAQRETDWARRAVKPALGRWCDGYITIRGTWCEPLNNEVVRRLNRRLKQVASQQSNSGPPC